MNKNIVLLLVLLCMAATGAPPKDFLKKPVRMGEKYFGSVQMLTDAYSWGNHSWKEKDDHWIYTLKDNKITLEFFMKERKIDVEIEKLLINGKKKQFKEEMAQSMIEATISAFTWWIK